MFLLYKDISFLKWKQYPNAEYDLSIIFGALLTKF